ncbi:MAG: TonB-dependent receptor [Pseudomonadota bacterium]
MKLRASVLAATALCCAGVATAQSISNDEIVVYGARLNQPIAEVGSSVGIITAEDIKSLGVDYVLDAIATIPGVTVNQNGPFGGVATVRIRGAASEQTLVIVDGVVVNDPSSPGGGFDFSWLDSSSIDRIEVLKGPHSTLWGTDAIGGVVNIVTKRPQDGVTGSAFGRFGSFDTLRAGADVGYATGRYHFRLSAVSHDTDGISKADERNGNPEKDGYNSKSVNLSAGVHFTDNVRLTATVMQSNADTEYDSFSFGAPGNVGDGNEESKTEQLTGNLALHAAMLDGRFTNVLQLGYSDVDRRYFTDGAQIFSAEGDRTSWRYQGTFDVNERNRLAFGAEHEDSQSGSDDTSITGLFALYELKPVDNWTLTAGLRQDDHERYDAETTARVAAAWNPNDQWTLRASWGEGFKAPTLFQTTFFCCGATEPNPDLRAEYSDALDVGFAYRTTNARGVVELTYFDQDITDLITFSFGVGGYENIAEVRSKGFELDAAYRFTDWLDVSFNYANIDAKDGTGSRLIRMPEHSGDVQFTFNPEGRFSGTLLTRYNGEESDPNGTVDSWTRVDIAGTWQANDTVEIFARIENLFDEDYQQVLGYGTPGLSGYLGARLQF